MGKYEIEAITARGVALHAGEILRKQYGALLTMEMKGRRDWCTEVDLASDKLIQETLRREFPKDDIISEESDPLDRGSSRKWIIDPLDGTWAYTRGFPVEVPSVSIAFIENGIPQVGVIYSPLAEKPEMYWAERHSGAWLNDYNNPIKVNPSLDLATATVGHDIGKKDRWRIGSVVTKLLQNDGVMACPSFGGAASTYARVASGVLHGVASIGLDVWDMAAAAVILSEAGAYVSELDGTNWDLSSGSLLAANPHMHTKLLRLLNG